VWRCGWWEDRGRRWNSTIDIIPKHHQTRRIYDWVDRAAHTGGVGAVVDRVVRYQRLASVVHYITGSVVMDHHIKICMHVLYVLALPHYNCTYSSISLRLVEAGGASPFDTRDPMLIYRQILLYVGL